jgi:hypothetical protein
LQSISDRYAFSFNLQCFLEVFRAAAKVYRVSVAIRAEASALLLLLLLSSVSDSNQKWKQLRDFSRISQHQIS